MLDQDLDERVGFVWMCEMSPGVKELEGIQVQVANLSDLYGWYSLLPWSLHAASWYPGLSCLLQRSLLCHHLDVTHLQLHYAENSLENQNPPPASTRISSSPQRMYPIQLLQLMKILLCFCPILSSDLSHSRHQSLVCGAHSTSYPCKQTPFTDSSLVLC